MSFWDSIQSVDHPHGADLKIYAHNRGRPVGNYNGAQNAEGISVMSRLPDGRVLSTGKIGNDITHAHFDDKSSEMIGAPKYPKRSMLGQHDTELESVIAMHKAHPDYLTRREEAVVDLRQRFQAIIEGYDWSKEGGLAGKQPPVAPVRGQVVRGTENLGMRPTTMTGKPGAKPPVRGMPQSPAAVVHDVMSTATGIRRSKVKPDESSVDYAGPRLFEAIASFRGVQAFVEAMDKAGWKAQDREQRAASRDSWSVSQGAHSGPNPSAGGPLLPGPARGFKKVRVGPPGKAPESGHQDFGSQALPGGAAGRALMAQARRQPGTTSRER
jgi:hypothetical protein